MGIKGGCSLRKTPDIARGFSKCDEDFDWTLILPRQFRRFLEVIVYGRTNNVAVETCLGLHVVGEEGGRGRGRGE